MNMNEDTRLGNVEELVKITGLAIATGQKTLDIRVTTIDFKKTETENYLISQTIVLGQLFDHVFTSQSNYIEARNIYREIKRQTNN